MGTDNIVEVQMQLKVIVDDLSTRIKRVTNLYAGSIENFPKCPEFNKISQSKKDYYEFYTKCLEVGDEITCLMVSVSLVLESLEDMKRTKLNRDRNNEYSLVVSLKKFLEGSISNLKSSKYDMIEIKRQMTDRIKLLQSLGFM